MSTAIVSGRVDVAVRDRANAYIHAAGLTPADVVKRVWGNIAKTGEIPATQEQPAKEESDDPFEQFLAFCETLPEPQNDWISSLSDEQMKDMLKEHVLEKYA